MFNRVERNSNSTGVKSDYTRLDTPALHIPDIMPILAGQEAPQNEEGLPTAKKELDDIMSRLATPTRWLEVDTLLHIRRTSLRRYEQPYLYLIVTVTSCAIAILLIG
jgi:hypothetical protein